MPPDERLARWAGWLPILACLVCPACMSTYAKLLAMFAVFLLAGPWMLGTLIDFTRQLFSSIPQIIG